MVQDEQERGERCRRQLDFAIRSRTAMVRGGGLHAAAVGCFAQRKHEWAGRPHHHLSQHSLIIPEIRINLYVYNLQKAGERNRLIDSLRKGDLARDDTLSHAANNSVLCDFLESSTVDGKDVQ
eukprot:2088323-Pleurochrysis_carterae.AAC.1